MAVNRITSPQGFRQRLFLGGGITGCPDWQSTITNLIEEYTQATGAWTVDVDIVNPRRTEWNPSFDNQAESEKQVQWEFNQLWNSNSILFWFCKETLCPITLFELGVWSTTHKKIFVGVEPGYQRLFDVKVQMKFARPDVAVVDSMEALARQVSSHLFMNQL